MPFISLSQWPFAAASLSSHPAYLRAGRPEVRGCEYCLWIAARGLWVGGCAYRVLQEVSFRVF
jgi:hypothetical protein